MWSKRFKAIRWQHTGTGVRFEAKSRMYSYQETVTEPNEQVVVEPCYGAMFYTSHLVPPLAFVYTLKIGIVNPGTDCSIP